MPVSGVYQWTQTEGSVELVIPLKGVSPKIIDVLLTEIYLKVSYRPFLLEIDLLKAVDTNKSRAVLENGNLIICLKKKEGQTQWDDLCFEGTKDQIKLRRTDALSKREESVKNIFQKAKENRIEEGRMMLRKQMDLERDERERIDKTKENEKVEAEKAMYETLTKIGARENDTNDGSAQSQLGVWVNDDLSENNMKNSSHKNVNVCLSKAPAEIIADNDIINTLPRPRQSVRALIKHTPRLFKTPSRESTVEQENLFVMKNRPHLVKNKLLNRDGLDISENDPIWLKEKGDRFCNNNDFASAIQAYSIAIEMDESFVQAFSKRAFCYFQCFEWHCCVQDCTTALTLVPNHGPLTNELLSLRGLAYCHLGQFEDATYDFKNMHENNNDSSVIGDLCKAKKLLKANRFKKDADKLASEGNYDEAMSLYNKSTDEFPSFIGALINKSTCFMALGKFDDCIKQCNEAITLVDSRSKLQSDILSDVYCSIPPRNKTEHSCLMSKLLLRKGISKVHLSKYVDGLDDLNKALSFLEPDSIYKHHLLIDIENIRKNSSTIVS